MTSEAFLRHHLTLDASEASSGQASEWVRGLAEAAGLPEERAYALDLCVVELVSNIVDHSYRKGPGSIRLELDLAPAAAVLTVLDHGPAFDPLSVAAPAVPTSLAEAPIGGLGVQLVRSAADACRYERREGRNVFTAYFGARA